MIRRVYDATVRKHLPRKLGVLNGVTVRQPRLLDFTDRNPTYEQACIASLRGHVAEGDDVVVVGGGAGVSSIVAAREAGTGNVTVFEATQEQCEVIEETLDINFGGSRVQLRHAIVAEAVDAWGDTDGADVVPPEALPEADVMEIDAEGAEQAILDGLDQRPRVLIVESHGHLGRPTDQIREQMERMGYRIEGVEPEVEEKDVMVLTGVRE